MDPELLSNLLPLAGAFVGTLALAWAVAKFPRKRLEVEILHNVCVAERYSGAPKTLEWEGAEVPTEDVYEVLLDVRNSGNVPIVSSDFERPLDLFFDSESVLLVEVLEETPEDLEAVLKSWSNRVRLEPLLLNAGDSVGMEVWVHRYGGVRAEGRVVGVDRIRRFSTAEDLFRRSLLGTAMFVGAVAIWAVTTAFPQVIPRSLNLPVLGFIAAGFAVNLRDTYRIRAAMRRLKRKAGKQRALHEKWDR